MNNSVPPPQRGYLFLVVRYDRITIMDSKTCTQCGIEKNLDEFHKDARGRYGRSARCADCARAHVNQYRKSNAMLIKYKRMEQAALRKDIEYIKDCLGVDFRPERTDRDRLRSVYNQARQRCNNPNNAKYPRYGGRGIQFLFKNFEEFYNWSLVSGYQHGLQIDRINNDGHYEPANCRWATGSEQVRNRYVTVFISAFGERKSVADWVDDPRCMVNYTTLIQRQAKSTDWTPEEMITIEYQPNQNGSRVKRKEGDVQ